MLIIDPSHEIIGATYSVVQGINLSESTTDLSLTGGSEQLIERAARTCYKSEDKITKDSHIAMLKSLKNKGHLAMLEHACATVKFVTNRGVLAELTRHRIASFAVESTRYVNYEKKGCVFIRPVWCENMALGEWVHDLHGVRHAEKGWDGASYTDGGHVWLAAMDHAERGYLELLQKGWKPEQAREVLPQSAKTEIVISCNMREWLHIFNLRSIGTTGRPHPEMVRIMQPCMQDFKSLWPAIFGDLEA